MAVPGSCYCFPYYRSRCCCDIDPLLRQQLILLRRKIKRPTSTKKDRILLLLPARVIFTGEPTNIPGRKSFMLEYNVYDIWNVDSSVKSKEVMLALIIITCTH